MGESGTAARRNQSHDGRQVNLACVKPIHPTRPTPRTTAVGLRFGVPLSGPPITVVPTTRLPIAPGQVILVTGPSGAGKTTVVELIHRQCARTCMVQRMRFPATGAIVDSIAPSQPLASALAHLTQAGLSQPSLWLRTFRELSAGEQFRAQLARATAKQDETTDNIILVCDAFCETLHTRLARAISYNLRKLATQRKLSIVVASVRDDFVTDLQPDTILRLAPGGSARLTQKRPKQNRMFTLRNRLSIRPGHKRDYEAFAAMHYRQTDELGFVSHVFTLSDRHTDEHLGIVVYAHSPLELALRNQATGKRFVKKPDLLNQEMRILRRLIIHPDVRGCGLGRHLVRGTLPRVGTRMVECLAGMGTFNPVFERAGMQRIGTCALSAKRRRAIDRLRTCGVDPQGDALAQHIADNRAVRAIVTDALTDWYTATTAAGTTRLKRQSPQRMASMFTSLIASQPVYYLWRSKRRHIDAAKIPSSIRSPAAREAA